MDLWVVGQWTGKESGWSFQGVFSDAALAEAACRDRTYFMAPAQLDAALPHECRAWPGLRYPVAERE